MGQLPPGGVTKVLSTLLAVGLGGGEDRLQRALRSARENR